VAGGDYFSVPDHFTLRPQFFLAPRHVPVIIVVGDRLVQHTLSRIALQSAGSRFFFSARFGPRRGVSPGFW